MRRMTVKVRLSTMASAIAMTACLGAIHAPAYADEAAAKRWIDTEFQPSTLSKDERKALPAVPTLAVGDYVVITGTWALASPHAEHI